MAKQPFLPTHRGKDTAVGLGVLENNPTLAALVGRCAFAWTWVDLHLALAMGSLLGVDNKASVAVFASLRNSRAQRDALKAAANTVLKGEMSEVFAAILNIHSTLDKARNDIVHGVWGASTKLQYAAIWTSLQDMATQTIESYHQENLPRDPEEVVIRMVRDYFVYPLADIEKTVSEIQALAGLIANFHVQHRYHGRPAAEEALRQLCSESLLQKEMERMRSSEKHTP
jgi:hypothetical protein